MAFFFFPFWLFNSERKTTVWNIPEFQRPCLPLSQYAKASKCPLIMHLLFSPPSLVSPQPDGILFWAPAECKDERMESECDATSRGLWGGKPAFLLKRRSRPASLFLPKRWRSRKTIQALGTSGESLFVWPKLAHFKGKQRAGSQTYDSGHLLQGRGR